jgi:hypothetical protein
MSLTRRTSLAPWRFWQRRLLILPLHLAPAPSSTARRERRYESSCLSSTLAIHSA